MQTAIAHSSEGKTLGLAFANGGGIIPPYNSGFRLALAYKR